MSLVMRSLRPQIEQEIIRLLRLVLPFEAGMIQTLLDEEYKRYAAAVEEGEDDGQH
jgi:hypothetical protein